VDAKELLSFDPKTLIGDDVDEAELNLVHFSQKLEKKPAEAASSKEIGKKRPPGSIGPEKQSNLKKMTISQQEEPKSLRSVPRYK